MTEVGPPHLLRCVGGAGWDRGGTAPPTCLCGWGRGGIEVGPARARFRVGGTEVGPRWDHPTHVIFGGAAPTRLGFDVFLSD